MCILCGELVMNVHWTDQKTHDQQYGGKGDPGDTLRDTRRGRLKRVAYVNGILSYYGLNLSDWNGIRYVLSDKKGIQKVVGDLGEMWAEAQKLCANKIDPLDPALLSYISAQGRAGQSRRT